MSIKVYRPLNRAPHEYEEYDESMSRRTIEQNFHLSGNERITVDVHYRDSRGNINMNRVMDHYYFVPDDRGMGYALPLDLAWIPGLHGKIEHVAGDWFFRSPVVSLASKGVYATLIKLADQMLALKALD